MGGRCGRRPAPCGSKAVAQRVETSGVGGPGSTRTVCLCGHDHHDHSKVDVKKIKTLTLRAAQSKDRLKVKEEKAQF